MRGPRPDFGQIIALPWLSHHGPGELDRCFTIPHGGGCYLVCARCCGLYFGLGLGFALFMLDIASPVWLAILPLPSMLDWTLYKLNLWRGTNSVRAMTGIPLGVAYSLIALYPLLELEYTYSLLTVASYSGWYLLVQVIRRLRVRRLFGW